MSSKIKISAVINTKNESKKIKRCLRSLVGFAQEIIVVDMYSKDDTVSIAKSMGAKVYRHKPIPWVEPARNYAISKAKGEWILILDPDEYITTGLKMELKKICQRQDVNYVKIPRKNIIFNKWMRHSGMWPDYIIRFFRKDSLRWRKEIHSQPDTQGEGVTLLDSEKLAIRHNNYYNIDDFVKRAIRYSDTQANQLVRKNYVLKTSDLILKPMQEFNSRFFANSGFRDGFHGLAFCLLQSMSICLIYLKVWEKQGFDEKNLSKESFVSASLESNYEYHHWFSKYFTKQYSRNIVKNIIIRFQQLTNRFIKNF